MKRDGDMKYYDFKTVIYFPTLKQIPDLAPMHSE